MTSIMNAVVNQVLSVLFGAAQRSADANGTGVDVSAYEGQVKVVADVTFVSGTSTADVILEESDVVGSGYTAIPLGVMTNGNGVAGTGFPQVTTASKPGSDLDMQLHFDVGARKKFIRARLDVGAAGSPVYGVGVYLHGQKKSTP